MSYLLPLGVNRRLLLRILKRWDIGTVNENDLGQNQELRSCEHGNAVLKSTRVEEGLA